MTATIRVASLYYTHNKPEPLRSASGFSYSPRSAPQSSTMGFAVSQACFAAVFLQRSPPRSLVVRFAVAKACFATVFLQRSPPGGA